MRERKVTFTVDAGGGVSPIIPQYGGVKGEHRITTLVFQLPKTDPPFYEAGQLVRLVFFLGDGAVVSSDLLQDTLVDHGTVWTLSYALPRTVTVPAGQLSVRLAVSQTDAEGNEVQMFLSKDAVLYFDDAAVENGTPFWRGVSEMLAGTAAACETTRELRDETEATYQKTVADAEALRLQAIADVTAIRDETAAVRRQAIDDMTALREQAVADVETVRDQTAALYTQAVADVTAIRDETVDIGEQAVADVIRIRDQTEAFRDETQTMLTENGLFRYGGAVTGPTLAAMTDMQVGDVYTVTDDGRLYVWTGQEWYALSDHLIGVDGTTLTIV